ncbi:MAG: class I tRNA ligase family protein [Pseudomonadota bacterium]
MKKPLFNAVPTELDFPKYEQQILDLWGARGIFEKALAAGESAQKKYVFYEGPPTANGLPHNGHVLTRVMKDLFPRYHAMLGEQVLRKGGWDTHGLPVEVEVEKELRIHGKAAIEQFGVEPFVKRCIESVFRYTSEWERLTSRIGFWVSLEDAYVTYHKSYVESVWWALSELFNKGLLYQGQKVVWWWAQGGTALSAAEVGLGYKTVDDPSVYVAFPLVDEPETALVVWTTTPWTLPSNSYAALRPNTQYDVVRVGDALEAKAKKPARALTLGVTQLVVASELRAALSEKLGHELIVQRSVMSAELAGKRYRPPFDFYAKTLADARVALKAGGDDALWWRVIVEDFVTLDAGTGIVHVAPAFGEDDHNAHRKQLARYADPLAVELLCAILPNGEFKPDFGSLSGRWVKSCDRDIIHDLQQRKLLVFEEIYRHDYPYCWRSDEDPLIQLARPAWFIRTTARLDDALANNQAVNWLPEHIKDGRFGDFLNNNVDWALSRERYWGTPLNVWSCTADPEHKHAPASIAEIEARNPHAFAYFHEERRKNPELSPHLQVHKPWIDHVTFPCPTCGAEMRRATEVIDCWFDSGCMPFAQWGFPHQAGSAAQFDAAFPADFISEAIDQTRGWFYSLLMISSLVFDRETQARLGLSKMREFPYPFQSCIVLGHVCDREGKKESKSKGNYTPPEIILDRVRMDFGVLCEAFGQQAAAGEALIAREDLEGMDLEEGANVVLYRPDRGEHARPVKLRVLKKLPRRVLVLADADRTALAVDPIASGLGTMPQEVPRAAFEQRVTVEDPHTPAPGADAFRWFFYASSPPWSNTRHSLRNVRTLQKDFLIKIRNVYSFFTIYANIDGWSPNDRAHAGCPPAERNLLDRWLLSELNLTVKSVRSALDQYMSYDAALALIEFAESLSNWYVRRSRSRFWAPGLEQDKRDAYATLHEALAKLSLLIAPFVPFLSEEMYQNLLVSPGVAGAAESVHLDRFPICDEAVIDQRLVQETRAVRDIVSLGLSVRTANKLKVRQPLERADVVFNDGALMPRLEAYKALIQEELNVHEVRFMFPGHADGAVAFRIKPNFRALGPRLGKNVQAAKKALEGADGSALYAELSRTGKVEVTIEGEPYLLGPEEIQVTAEAAPGFAAETGPVGVVVLHTTLTEALVDEGLLREVASRVQAARKDLGLEFTARVQIWLDGSERLLRVVRAGERHLSQECLASEVKFALHNAAKEHVLGEEALRLHVARVTP